MLECIDQAHARARCIGCGATSATWPLDVVELKLQRSGWKAAGHVWRCERCARDAGKSLPLHRATERDRLRDGRVASGE